MTPTTATSAAGMDIPTRLWSEQGGQGGPILLLLHGLGACASVWDGLKPILSSRWPGRWIAPDFRGHGRSFHGGPYGYSVHAADVASLLEQEDEVVVLGHSMGGAVGMALAGGHFGIRVRRVVAFSVKLEFTDAETAKMREIGGAPVRWFASQEEAVDRYLKVSGMKGLVDPDSDAARHGIAEPDGKFRLAMDPHANLVAGASMEPYLRAMEAPLHLAAGGNDPMVSFDQMRRVDCNAITIPGYGHNLHVEAPDQLWQHLEPLLTAR
jgi:pimeloyl-ACP methyl ester carboxylesterase